MAVKELKADVVIVGAGVSGALIAYELVKAGHSVLMLEAGPDKTTQGDRNILVDNFYKAEQKTSESPYPIVEAAKVARVVDQYEVPYRGYLDQVASQAFEKGGKAEELIKKQNKEKLTDGENEALNKLYDKRNDWFKSTNERRVGGTTWHWLGTCLRLVPGDFEMRTRFSGEAYFDRLKAAGDTEGLRLAKEYPLPEGFVDWPFQYKDMKEWYTKAEREMGVSGDPSESLGGADRTAPNGGQEPFPMPKVPPSYLDSTIGKAINDKDALDPDTLQPMPGFKDLKLKVQSTPQGRNSVGGYQGRPQCCGNSSCIPICPIHAKYDATVHVNLCRERYARLFTLVAQAVASEVLLDESGKKVVGIKCKRWGGTDGEPNTTGPFPEPPTEPEFTVKGKIYVIAAHAIETPKLLLNSKSGPGIFGKNGVANSSDNVGRYLMDHNTSLSYALACEPIYPFRGPVATSGIETLKDNNARGYAGTFRVEIGNIGWQWPDDAPHAQVFNHARTGKWGGPLKETLKNEISRQFRFGALVEPTPDPNHTVTLSETQDFLGIPRPKIKYGISDDPYCQRGYVNSLRVHQYVFQLMKCTNINHVGPLEYAGAGHIMGTCRMGNDKTTSVVNKMQQSHDHDNLYITGSSVFPTVGASNPTLTIGALSLWAADTIKKQLA